MAKPRFAHWGHGVAFLDDKELQDMAGVDLNDELDLVTHEQSDGTELQWVRGRKVTGTIEFKALNDSVIEKLTGLTSGNGTYTRLHRFDTSHIIDASNEIKLIYRTTEIVENTLTLRGANGTKFKKVDAAPDAGEFTFNSATNVCTFNSSETDTTIYPDYIYKGGERTGTATDTIAFDGANYTISLGVTALGEQTTVTYSSTTFTYTESITPAASEFTVSGTKLKFNSADNGKEVDISYTYIDANAGNKLRFNPGDLPNNKMEIWGLVRNKDLNNQQETDLTQDTFFHLDTVRRIGSLNISGNDDDSTSSLSFEFEAEIDINEKLEFYFPQPVDWIADELVDYAGEQLVDYSGELLIDYPIRGYLNDDGTYTEYEG